MIALLASGALLPHAARAAAPAEETLLLEIVGGSTSLADGVLAIARDGVLLVPLAALTEALELEVTVAGDAATGRRADGLAFSYDGASGRLDVDGVARLLPAHARLQRDGDLFVALPAAEAILGIRLALDREAMQLAVASDRPLAYQLRAERQARRVFTDIDAFADAPVVTTPYVAFSPPAIDINAGIDIGRASPRTQGRYDVRAGGDLLWMGYQAFIGSDGDGVPSNVRLTFERTDLDGRVAGVTRLAAGDVFSPSLAVGPRSTAGRGVYATSEPLEQVSVFDRIDLRGELPAGFDVELYVNNVLRGSQFGRGDGRYDFEAVPLSRGPNQVRLVFYGPRGERTEQVRTINVGSGQVPTGVTRFTVGAVEQDVALIRIRNDRFGAITGLNGRGSLRAVLGVAHGISESITLVGGAGAYTPDRAGAEARGLVSIGVRSGLGGLALQADGAADSRGGGAAVLGLAGRAAGISFVARHGEYFGGFVDEISLFLDPSRTARRSSDLRLDSDFGLGGSRRVPVSAGLNHIRYTDGTAQWFGSGRASLALARGFLSFGVEHNALVPGDRTLNATRRTALVLESDTTLDGKWQIRASSSFDLSAAPRAGTLSLVADRRFGERFSWRLGATHSYGAVSDTLFQTAANWRLPFGDFSLGGAYQRRDSVWRVAASFSLGLLHDPLTGRYRITRPGAATGGALALRALVPPTAALTERRIEGVGVYGGLWPATTDGEGHALISGLGGPRTRVRIDDESVADPYLRAPSAIIELRPRPGRTARYDYRLSPVSDAMLRLKLRLPDGATQPLAALPVRLEPLDRPGEPPRSGRTQFDGSLFFEGLTPGRWRLALEPAAEKLGLVLAQPIEIIVADSGGPVPTTDIIVERAPR